MRILGIDPGLARVGYGVIDTSGGLQRMLDCGIIRTDPGRSEGDRMVEIARDLRLLIRTWRDIARYTGAEVRSQEGEAGLMRLPWVMEDVFEAWQSGLTRPQFKAEYPVHYGCLPAMTAAANAAARRLGFDAEET